MRTAGPGLSARQGARLSSRPRRFGTGLVLRALSPRPATPFAERRGVPHSRLTGTRPPNRHSHRLDTDHRRFTVLRLLEWHAQTLCDGHPCGFGKGVVLRAWFPSKHHALRRASWRATQPSHLPSVVACHTVLKRKQAATSGEIAAWWFQCRHQIVGQSVGPSIRVIFASTVAHSAAEWHTRALWDGRGCGTLISSTDHALRKASWRATQLRLFTLNASLACPVPAHRPRARAWPLRRVHTGRSCGTSGRGRSGCSRP